jgi:AcrR family transcriptional regulator
MPFFKVNREGIVKQKGRKESMPAPSKGTQTRQQIVDRALNIAAQEGFGALSIGRLAKEVKMSKSGLFLHFGSKANLESAVVERASLHLYDHILVPIEEKGLVGIERVWALCDSWLDFVEQGILPGGYFFTGAYFQCARQSGPIPSQIKRVVRDWLDTLAEALHQARRRDEVRSSVDAEQAAFELNRILIGAQWSQLMTHTDPTSARSDILVQLRDLATEEIPTHAFSSVKAWKVFLDTRNR